MNDVEPRLYPSVIREMIRHENDLTNHRIMWLLIGEGLIANTVATAGDPKPRVVEALALVGILVALSAFVILYKSYQARGYLQFLGAEAKSGRLHEEFLPIFGWPARRARNWRKESWLCPWLGAAGDLLEPYFALPALLLTAWSFVVVRYWMEFSVGHVLLILFADAALLSGICLFLVWIETNDEEDWSPQRPGACPNHSSRSHLTLDQKPQPDTDASAVI